MIGLLSFFAFLCVLQTFRIYIAYIYVNRKKGYGRHKFRQSVFLIIPVLREQGLIVNSVESFSKLATGQVHIVYVTSAKEKTQNGEQTTLDILNKLKIEYPIEVIHCPIVKNASMAHQINYAIKKIIDKQKDEPVFGIYNVDSQVTLKSIKEATAILVKNYNSNIVVQQYTLYPSVSGGIISHIALWQNRWSLHFELGRVLMGQNKYFRKICRTFNYVIGHGLFFTKRTWYEIGGLPQSVANEDAAMSLSLYTQNYCIHPMHNIEYALIAKNLSVYIKQQSVWFNGPFYSFLYALKLYQSRGHQKFFLYNCYIGAIKLFAHALYWLLGPIFIWLVIPLYYHNSYKFLIAWYCVALYHCYVLNIITMYYVNKIKKNTILNVGNIIDSIFAYILHCVGPWYSVIKILLKKNSIKDKYKTEK